MSEPPAARLAHIGGSGTWAFPYPDGALDGHPHLAVEVVRAAHPGRDPVSARRPPFRLCRLTDRRTGRSTDYLYVWMHGIDPENRSDAPGNSARASERVFDVLQRAGVRRVIVDNSTGGVAEDLSPWDLAVVGDVLDLSGVVPRPVVPGAHPVPRPPVPPARPAPRRRRRARRSRARRRGRALASSPKVKRGGSLRPHPRPLVRDADGGPPLPPARPRPRGQDGRPRVPPGPHVRHVSRHPVDRGEPGRGAGRVRARRPPRRSTAAAGRPWRGS